MPSVGPHHRCGPESRHPPPPEPRHPALRGTSRPRPRSPRSRSRGSRARTMPPPPTAPPAGLGPSSGGGFVLGPTTRRHGGARRPCGARSRRVRRGGGRQASRRTVREGARPLHGRRMRPLSRAPRPRRPPLRSPLDPRTAVPYMGGLRAPDRMPPGPGSRRNEDGFAVFGGVAERFKAAVLKTAEGSRPPKVRILPPPPGQKERKKGSGKVAERPKALVC